MVPESLSNKSGAVFYSGKRAFKGQADLYILGINPGGDPQVQIDETVESHTRQVLNDKPANWSEYRDESWEGHYPGTYRMQPRILHLCKRLKLDPGEIPASNLVFARSKRKATLDGEFPEMARACWPLHQAVVDELGVNVILCLGRESGDWVCDQVGARNEINRFVEQNSRRWTSVTYINEIGLAVVVATHPSIAKWQAPNTDPTGLVRRALRLDGR